MRAVHAFGSLGLGLVLLASGGGQAWGDVVTPARRDTLIHQKLLLLDNLLSSPALRGLQRQGAATVRSDLDRAGRLRDEAHGGLASGNEHAAEAAADAALRAAAAAATAGRSTLPEVLRSRNADLRLQVHDYAEAIASALMLQGRNQDARLGRPQQDARVTHLERKLDEAASLDAAGRHGEANRLLADAYRQAVSTLSELRAGETVVLELKFATPAEEFAYEQRRNESHAMLVDMQLQEGLAEEVNAPLIQRHLEANRRLRSQAEGKAATGNWQAAIRELEEATLNLVRALRLTGMLIF